MILFQSMIVLQITLKIGQTKWEHFMILLAAIPWCRKKTRIVIILKHKMPVRSIVYQPNNVQSSIHFSSELNQMSTFFRFLDSILQCSRYTFPCIDFSYVGKGKLCLPINVYILYRFFVFDEQNISFFCSLLISPIGECNCQTICLYIRIPKGVVTLTVCKIL